MGTKSWGRQGASLTEVLIALVILTIGLTSVIALFPVGVNRVRNAALDTRTTIMASNAHSLFSLKRMANDPAIVDLAAFDVISAAGAGAAAEYTFDDPVRNPLAFTAWSPQVGGWNGPWGAPNPSDLAIIGIPTIPPPLPPAYPSYAELSLLFNSSLNLNAGLVQRNIGNVAVDWLLGFRERLLAEDDDVFGLFAGGVLRTDAIDVPADYNLSYPVLLDPYLYDAMSFQFGLLNPAFPATPPAFPAGVPRINIATPMLSNTGTPVPGFENHYGSSSFTGIRPFADIAVLSLSEITLLPAGAVSIDRETVKARWFASLADINYLTDVPGQPANPSSQDFLDTTGTLIPLTPRNYFEPVPVDGTLPPSSSNPIRPTAQRDYEYTWAAMFQRRLVPPKEGSGPETARPNVIDRDFRGKLAILCFYRRNLQQPYRVIEGCFYTGSRVATLSWPSNLPAPSVIVGSWLCEASISRSTMGQSLGTGLADPLLGSTSTLTGVYIDDSSDPGSPVVDYDVQTVPPVLLKSRRLYRRAFSFHRVTAVGDVVDDTANNRSYLQVTLERPAVGFPLQYQNPLTGALGPLSGQDDRPIDAYPPFGRPGSGVTPGYNPPPGVTSPISWPIVDRIGTTLTFPLPVGTITSFYNDETNCTQAALMGLPPAEYDQYSFYYPVILFDGLREVFEYNTD
ncbi:hypothetical protein K2X85_17615 [bacterium]|nr:hypothetical protein [bacterium]